MPPAWIDSPLMKAARREPVARTPVWLMRQAGRFLPEYRRLREKVAFLDLCKSPDLCAEIACTTVERLGVDAAILFSDLLVILEPMGMELEYSAGEGPVLHNPIRSAADVDRMLELDSVEPLGYVMEAVRKTRAGLAEAVPLIGFAGAPFTLAAYAIEGGASRDYRRAKALMYRDTGAWDALMGRLSRAAMFYLNAQIDAGAQVVQLFDSWAAAWGRTTIAAMYCPTPARSSKDCGPRRRPFCLRPAIRRSCPWSVKPWARRVGRPSWASIGASVWTTLGSPLGTTARSKAISIRRRFWPSRLKSASASRKS